ncbi:MAG: hypothetical protein GY737_06935 [Desulfobacteraceae bacterium]|nr:hypothetical protein [Desulfobacteraceae bacterium]
MNCIKKVLLILSSVFFLCSFFPPTGIATVSHNQLTQWVTMDSGTQEDLLSIWGTSNYNIYATGNNGLILHWDGDTWTPMDTPTNEPIVDIWGRSSRDIYAVGGSGTQLHYDGSEWKTMGAIPHPIGRVSGVSGNSSVVYCSLKDHVELRDNGADIMKLYGGNWETRRSERFCPCAYEGDPNWVRCLDARRNHSFNDIHVQADGTYFVGGWDQVANRPVAYMGQDNISGYFENTFRVLGIWGTGSVAYFVGSNSKTTPAKMSFTKYKSNDFNRINLDLKGSIWDVWGSGEDNIFLASSNGKVLHYNGEGVLGSITGTNVTLFGVWGTDDENVYAVGCDGTILYYNGNRPPETTITLVAPENASTQAGDTVNFEWEPVSWAASYTLAVSETKEMTQFVLNSNVGNVTTMEINGFLNYGRPYFWQVTANDGQGHTVSSEIHTFDNGTATAPILLTPRHGANVSGTSVRMAWNPLKNATHYLLQLSPDSDFTNLVWQNYVHNTEITLSGFPDNGTPYYWRVVGFEGETMGPYWSMPYLFVNGKIE